MIALREAAPGLAEPLKNRVLSKSYHALVVWFVGAVAVALARASAHCRQPP